MGEVKNPQNADMLLSTGDEFPCSYPQASAALVRCLNIPLNIDKLKRVLFRLDSYRWQISPEHLRSLFLKQKKLQLFLHLFSLVLIRCLDFLGSVAATQKVASGHVAKAARPRNFRIWY